MSSGTARLKRRLDEQGVNYTNKRAVENFCLVRLSAQVYSILASEGQSHLSRADRYTLTSPGEKGRQ
jgi:hypothetical protein